jgi:hypothetical protein
LGDFGLAIRVVNLRMLSEHNSKSINKPIGRFHIKNMVGTLLHDASVLEERCAI